MPERKTNPKSHEYDLNKSQVRSRNSREIAKFLKIANRNEFESVEFVVSFIDLEKSISAQLKHFLHQTQACGVFQELP